MGEVLISKEILIHLILNLVLLLSVLIYTLYNLLSGSRYYEDEDYPNSIGGDVTIYNTTNVSDSELLETFSSPDVPKVDINKIDIPVYNQLDIHAKSLNFTKLKKE
jgi:hypothetical protein